MADYWGEDEVLDIVDPFDVVDLGLELGGGGNIEVVVVDCLGLTKYGACKSLIRGYTDHMVPI